jgi:anti-anti-sigma factor
MTAARVETRTEGGSIHIALSGEIDLANAATVEDELRAAISHQPSAVLVDLTNLTYMDSVGISILFALVSRLKPLQTMPTLIVPLDTPIRRLIEIAGFETVVCLRPESH